MILATTHNLYVYSLPESELSTSTASESASSPKRPRKKSKPNPIGAEKKVEPLVLKKRIDLPESAAEGSTFRSVK